jgi:hypothetical protein
MGIVLASRTCKSIEKMYTMDRIFRKQTVELFTDHGGVGQGALRLELVAGSREHVDVVVMI